MEQYEPSGRKRPFEKREWVLLLIIFVVVQALVHFAAWRFAGSQNALGYITFAGTIVSIILAVLAIIYGFFQTAEQSRSTSTIGSQITSLYRVVESFQKAGGVLSEQLGQLGEISTGIAKAVALGEKSQEQITKVESAVEQIRTGSRALVQGTEQKTTSPTVLISGEAMSAYLSTMKVIPACCVFAVIVANGKGVKDRKAIRRDFFLKSYQDACAPDEKLLKGIEWVLGSYFNGVLATLSQYLTVGEKEVTVFPQFAKALRTILKKAKLKGEWEKVLNRLLEIDGDGDGNALEVTSGPAA